MVSRIARPQRARALTLRLAALVMVAMAFPAYAQAKLPFDTSMAASADRCAKQDLKATIKAAGQIRTKDLLGRRGIAIHLVADRAGNADLALAVAKPDLKKLGLKGNPVLTSQSVKLATSAQTLRLTVDKKQRTQLARALKTKHVKALRLTITLAGSPALAIKAKTKGTPKKGALSRKISITTAGTCAQGQADTGNTGQADSGTPPTSPTVPPTPVIPPPPTDEPSLIGPPIDPSVPTTIADQTKFLYTGTDPVQKDVSDGTIVEKRTAVLRGRVLDKDAKPLEGVKVTILDHPEYGYTYSRKDGAYDLAVNGGGQLTLNYEKEGFISAQRQIDAPWQDYTLEDDVVLIPADDRVSEIRTDANDVQVARSSPVTDEDGTRSETLIFAPGTEAEAVLPSGETRTLSQMHVRITEFTQGELGPNRMPAEIALNTGYTYAAEFSVDEAKDLQAKTVKFSKPVASYKENFLNFPVGQVVPVGYYDKDRATWVPQPNGRVVEILRIEDGKAVLAIDPPVNPLDPPPPASDAQLAALGISQDELKTLATLYEPGKTLWRVPMSHFTPRDDNPQLLPKGSWTTAIQALKDWWNKFHPDSDPKLAQNSDYPSVKRPCRVAVTSTAFCEPQSLKEGPIDVVGTGYKFYNPTETPGRVAARKLDITLTPPEVSTPDLRSVELRIKGAGREWSQSYGPSPGQSTPFIWDGNNAYGRPLECRQPFTVEVGYTYPAEYVSASEYEQSFGTFAGIPLTVAPARQEITLWSEENTELGSCDQRGRGLGGWTLGPQVSYDPRSKTLYEGDGTNRQVAQQTLSITREAGTGSGSSSGDGGSAKDAEIGRPWKLATAADGSYLIADFNNFRVRRVSPDGTIETVAGKGLGFSGDGGLATEAEFGPIEGVDVADDGSIYIADAYNHRIRKVTPDGIVETVAGSGPSRTDPGGYSGDGGPATEARLNEPTDVAVAPDGSFYIADMANDCIRRVGTDGIITTAAGICTVAGSSGDKGAARQLLLFYPGGIDVTEDGTLYIADTLGQRIRKVTLGGMMETVAGRSVNHQGGFAGDGGPAKDALLNWPADVVAKDDGTLFVADRANHRIRKIDPGGTITTVSGSGPTGDGQGGYSGDGGQATEARLNEPRGVALSKDGSLLVADTENNRVRSVASSAPGYSGEDTFVPSEGGSVLYRFNEQGRHLETVDATSGAPVYSFEYTDMGDRHGLLKSITDKSITDQGHNTTTIEYDTTGQPKAIDAPYGQRTTLKTNADGYLESITNPAGETQRFTYKAGGLVETYTNPNSGTSHYTYDNLGRLTRTEDPAGGSYDFERTDFDGGGYKVKVTSAEGRSHAPMVQDLEGGDQRRDIETAFGTIKRIFHPDGSDDSETPDGYKISTKESPDPRWGMQAPFTSSAKIEAPSGKKIDLSCNRDLSLFDPADPTKVKSYTQACTLRAGSSSEKTASASYDGETRTATSTSPEGRQSSAELDTEDRPVKINPGPGLCPLILQYDPEGRPASQSICNRQLDLTYNDKGYVETIKNHATGKGIENQAYDPAGRLTKQILPGDRPVGYTYDKNGNMTSIEPPGRPAYTVTYNAGNLPTSYKAPLTRAATLTYNKDKQAEEITRSDRSRIVLTYDHATGRMESSSYPGGKTDLVYDSTGRNLDRLISPDSTLAFTYNQDGQPIAQESRGAVQGKVGITYDDAGEPTATKVNDAHQATLAFDDDGLPKTAGELTLSRDPEIGSVKGTSLRNVTTTYGINDYSELTELRASFSGDTNLLTESPTYTDEGEIKAIEERIGDESQSKSYTYDDIGRLAEATRPDQTKAQYTYDDNGNRTSYKHYDQDGNLLSDSVTETSYDVEDRLTRYGDLAFTYSDNGELEQKTDKTDSSTDKITNYTYDGLGRLQRVALPDGKTVDYLYDGTGNRIGKKVNGDLVQGFLYASSVRPIAELNGQNEVVSSFVYGQSPVVPEYMIKGGKTYKLVTDHLESVRLVVDVDTGKIVQKLTYDEYGNITFEESDPGFSQPFGYAGGIYDQDTGLTRFGARDYDPHTGRWTTRDPIGLAGSLNVYAYVDGNPVNSIDPGGLIDCDPGFFKYRNIKNEVSCKNRSDLPKENIPYLDNVDQKWIDMFDDPNPKGYDPACIKKFIDCYNAGDAAITGASQYVNSGGVKGSKGPFSQAQLDSIKEIQDKIKEEADIGFFDSLALISASIAGDARYMAMKKFPNPTDTMRKLLPFYPIPDDSPFKDPFHYPQGFPVTPGELPVKCQW